MMKKYEYNSAISPIVKRVSILLLLGVTLCAGIGVLTFSILRESEVQTFNNEYNALSGQIIRTTKSMLSDSTLIAQSVAEIYSTQFESAEWPFVALPRYGQVIAPFLKLSGSININHVPLLKPSQVPAFESFAYNFFDNDPEGFAGLGISSIGKGIYGINATGQKYHDTTGNTSFSKYKIITPIFQVGNARNNSRVVLYNTHNEKVRGTGIDRVLRCQEIGNAPERCSAITDFIYLIQQEEKTPAAIMYYPETPATNRSQVVGFVGVVFTWAQLLEKTLPPASFANHISLVLTSFDSELEDSTTVTFDLSEKLSYRGLGDKSEPSLQRFRESAMVNSENGIAITSTKYYLSVVPNMELYDQYISNEPLYTSIMCSAILFSLLGMLILYDTLFHTKAHNDEIAQHLRKVYVRWMSHEMRSPLNGAYLAIADLEVELKAKMATVMPFKAQSRGLIEDEEDDSLTRARSDSDTVQNLLSEVKLGVENSVAVLEDLLEYSCLDKPNPAEYTEVDLWEATETVINTFKQSAKERGVALQLRNLHAIIHRRSSSSIGTIEDEMLNNAESASFSQKHVVRGDAFRLSRAISSVLRSSLKIASLGENIDVRVTYSLVDSGKKYCLHWISKDANTTLMEGSNVTIEFVHNCKNDAGDNQITTDMSEGQFNVATLRTDRHNSLALWMARSIVKSHGGALTVSRENDDVCTSITLPIVHIDNEKIAQHVSSVTTNRDVVIEVQSRRSSSSRRESDAKSVLSSNPEVRPQNTPEVTTESNREGNIKTYRILVVDDVLSNRKILARLLGSKGHECSMAVDGLDCIRVVTEGRAGGISFDAICMDFEMPNCDGPTATKRLRDMGFTMPIIGVTGNVLPEDIKHFKAQGANDVMAKPVRVEALEELLTAFIKNDSLGCSGMACPPHKEI